MAAGCHPEFDRTGNSVIRSADDENHIIEPNIKWIGSPVSDIWPFEYSMMAVGRHLEFDRTGDSAIRSANRENPAMKRNMQWIG